MLAGQLARRTTGDYVLPRRCSSDAHVLAGLLVLVGWLIRHRPDGYVLPRRRSSDAHVLAGLLVLAGWLIRRSPDDYVLTGPLVRHSSTGYLLAGLPTRRRHSSADYVPAGHCPGDYVL